MSITVVVTVEHSNMFCAIELCDRTEN